MKMIVRRMMPIAACALAAVATIHAPRLAAQTCPAAAAADTTEWRRVDAGNFSLRLPGSYHAPSRQRIDGAVRLAQRQIRSLVAGHSALSRRHVSRSRCREGESRHESDNGNGQDRHRRFEQSCDIELRVIERKAPWEPRSFTELRE